MTQPVTPTPFPKTPLFNRRPYWWLVKHWVGYRFRGWVRCPACKARGAYKAYGLWSGDRQVRRWLCKWCGYYDAVDGRFWAVMDRIKGTWVLPLDKVAENVDAHALEGLLRIWDKRVKAGEITTPKAIATREKFDPFVG